LTLNLALPYSEQFYFTISEDQHLKHVGFSKETLKIVPPNPEEETMYKAMEIQKRNLIREIEEVTPILWQHGQEKLKLFHKPSIISINCRRK
jgi:hypothetical protein